MKKIATVKRTWREFKTYLCKNNEELWISHPFVLFLIKQMHGLGQKRVVHLASHKNYLFARGSPFSPRCRVAWQAASSNIIEWFTN